MNVNAPMFFGARVNRVSETAGWLLVSIFITVQIFLPEVLILGRQSEMLVVTAFLATANLLYQGVNTKKIKVPFGMTIDGMVMAFNLAMVVAITFFLYFAAVAPSTAMFLYLIPVSVSVLVASPNSVLATAVFSGMSILFVREITELNKTFWDFEYIMALTVFLATSTCLALIARYLRRSLDGAESLSLDLSGALQKIRVISVLVRQGGHTGRIDEIAERTGKIIAEATGFESCVILMSCGQELRLPKSENLNEIENDISAFKECDTALLKGVISTGTARFFNRNNQCSSGFAVSPSIQDMLTVPLRVRDSSIGVLCLINGNRKTVSRECFSYSELLASFAASMLDTAIFCRDTRAEMDMVGRMNKLMVGRENKIRDIKKRVSELSVI